MQKTPPVNTLARFALRFAALIALTLAVLASVSVSASRDANPSVIADQVHSIPDTARDINSRRYPLSHPTLPR